MFRKEEQKKVEIKEQKKRQKKSFTKAVRRKRITAN